MSRLTNKAVRREQIINALLRVMSEKGYEKASIQSIAKAAQLTSGLIHYHFKTKQEILLELAHHIGNIVIARYERLRKSSNSAEQNLYALIDACLAKGADDDPAAVTAWVVIGAEAVRLPEVKVIYQGYISKQLKYLTELFKQALEENQKQTRNSKKYAATIVAAIEGAYQLSAAATEVMPKGYAAPVVKEIIANILHD